MGENEEVGLFSTSRGIFVVNEERTGGLFVGRIDSSDGKFFFHLKTDNSTSMFFFLKIFFFFFIFFLFYLEQCQDIAFSWPRSPGCRTPRPEGAPRGPSGPAYQCHRSSH